MDRFGEWRSIEPEEDEREKASEKPEVKADSGGRSDQLRLYAVLAAAVLAITGVAIWLTSGGSAAGTGNLAINAAAAFVPRDSAGTPPPTGGVTAVAAAAAVIVDVQGAVERPGVHRLEAGARVSDAIAAAGGYSVQVDIARAAAELNLAAPLADGAKVRVPSLGDQDLPTGSAGPGPTTGPAQTGLMNVNTATTEELDTLPGVGPVTAQKIIEARTEAPFATVDELLSRKVLGASTFENLRALITVGP